MYLYKRRCDWEQEIYSCYYKPLIGPYNLRLYFCFLEISGLGCAASDELILETYRQRRQIQLTQSTGKTTPAKKQDDSHLPKPESTCMGEYGPEKKRKDGTFMLKTDYNMYGIAHIVTKAAVSFEIFSNSGNL